MATKATQRSARWAKKNKAKTVLRQRMMLALAITASEDGRNALYFHEDAESLGVSEADRKSVASDVFLTLLALAGVEGKRWLRQGKQTQVIR